MKRLVGLLAAALAGCALLPPKTVILSRAESFRAQTAGVAALSGVQGRDFEVSRALVRAAQSAGLKAFSLWETDVLPGAVISADVLSDPRVLADLRRTSGADVVVLLTLEPDWSAATLTAVDTRTGDTALRAALKPSGRAFAGAEAAAQAAVPALSLISAAPPSTRIEDLPVP